ncbi:type IV toxin-antitoxin system AbiEi family antitoxin domain-containing protein [Jatrophihabitans telluris]|uniref:Type IV toxin-antitoxin system AbiEi family antitoxin domain-containing protein n=1 Tax=Jatrophihabitans telluris TaxID=2038343 RepID=A0ABY4QXJ4_9ACTN|nr:type IV toxin-antitoxin system AbiEi family antitoxin domain-containing protein [Jatrophihabitans telluris]UQX87726.1 type IV toxin-antitoxin system AbiEi family antitoxin domain-containing protein [Jatrophihabitans telluris]
MDVVRGWGGQWLFDTGPVRDVPPESAEQFGVFTAEQAYAAGWTHNHLARAVSREELLRLRRATFVANPAELDAPGYARFVHGRRGVAAALRVDGGTVSHAAAALLHDLPVLRVPAEPCLNLPAGYLTNNTALHLHRHRLRPAHLHPGSRVSLTSVARTCLDLTREHGLDEGLVAVDAALHAGLVTIGELAGIYAGFRGRAGLRSGRAVIDLADPRSESPLESLSRLNMRGLTWQPRTQVELYSPSGVFLGRADFYWDDVGLVGEADGMAKYTNEELRREKWRQDGMLAAGLFVTRWGWATARNEQALRRQLEAQLHRARALRTINPLTAIAA